MPSLSVVIVSYNTREDLRQCLEALRQSTLAAEVIVVDNASTDGSAEMVRAEFSDVMLIEPGHNTWFCGGNNLGVRAASRDYALLLNPDTIAPPEALRTLADFLDAHPDYAGATLQLRYPDGAIQRTCSRAPSLRYLLLTQTALRWLLPGPRKQAEAQHWYAGWERDRDFDVEAVPGSCVCMRREDLWLDESLRLYFNEDDLARRFPGRKFRFLAAPAILHREKSATRTAFASRLYFADLLTYTLKWHGRDAAALMWLLSRPLAWGIALRWTLKRRASS
ncbi:MAG TPA: glycosyltransferase family 2 protein [Candidatus Limnocylindrales bacterium]|nr:glycosyltransferase family 2 protein [Candidatus Limnocylindrales bacterium]